MNRLSLAALAAVAALGLAGGAEASTVLTGAIAGNGSSFGGFILTVPNVGAVGIDFLGGIGHLDLGPGSYNIQFSANVNIADLTISEAVNQDNVTTGSGLFFFQNEIGGPILLQDLTAPPGGQFGSLAYQAGRLITGSLFVPKSESFTNNDDPDETIVTDNTYSGIVAAEGFTNLGDPGGQWTLTVTSVPEPATWTLAIFGFGAIGAMLRRRRLAAA